MQESPLPADWRAENLSTETSTAPTEVKASTQYSFWLVSVLLIGATLWLYAPTVQWLMSRWKYDEYYEHGPLLPFISGYLIWQNKDALRVAWNRRPEQGLAPSGLIVFAFVLYWCGSLVEMNSIHALQGFSIPIFLLGVARYFGGKEFQRQLNFPLLFLFMAVPFSGPLVEKLTIPLQTYAASASGMLLGLMGMSITREGVNLYTPLYHFVVAVPCSGLKIGITLLTMGMLISHLMPNLTVFQRVGLCLLSVPVALIANTLRVMIIVSLGYYYGPKVAEGFLHSWSGLFMFALSLTALVSIGFYMGKVTLSAPDDSDSDSTPPSSRPEVSEGAVSSA